MLLGSAVVTAYVLHPSKEETEISADSHQRSEWASIYALLYLQKTNYNLQNIMHS